MLSQSLFVIQEGSSKKVGEGTVCVWGGGEEKNREGGGEGVGWFL